MASQHSREKHKKAYYYGRGSRRRERPPDSCRLFISNISYETREEELADYFASEFGPVISAEIVKDHKRHKSRGIGFVTFSCVKSAEAALSAGQERLILDGRDLKVAMAVSRHQCRAEARAEGKGLECKKNIQSKVEHSETSLECEEPSDVSVTSLRLNDDILLRVFTYLSLKERVRVERVCRQWQAVARSWWKTLKTLTFEGVFVSFRKVLTDAILSSILHRGCQQLLSLDLSASPTQLSDHSLQLIGKFCSELTFLNISRISTTPHSLKILTQNCTKLKTLIVRGSHSTGEKSLWWALHHCHDLLELDVSQNRRLNGQCFYMAQASLLKVLLQDCDNLTDDGVTLLAQRTPNLHYLNISKCGRLKGACLHSLAQVRRYPEVEYVEQESIASGMQIPWHLDRLDQRVLPLNQHYLPVGSGRGVDLYILDSGINYGHEEFENRAKYSGFDPIDFYYNQRRRGTDCHGHGTHVASLAAGKTYGVAKEARVYSVRVLDCDNSGPWSAVIQGLEHVQDMVRQRGRPAIISQSFGGSYFRSVDEAMRTVYSEGILTVSAAGNERSDACRYTPASSAFTFTVGGTRNDDDIYHSTNYGRCVDIFAPGESILGADYLCSTCSKQLSGTSMATPMVTGMAAILLSLEPLLQPQVLRERVVTASLKNVVTFSRIPSSFRSITKNRLLHVTGECGGKFRSPIVIRSPNYPNSYPHNLQEAPCQWTVTTSSTSRVQCNITDFDTEEDYDVVVVCDGENCCPSSVLAEVSGSLQTRPHFTSTNSALTIKMTSDGIISRRGFALSCASVAAAPQTPPPPTILPQTSPLPTSPPVTTPSTSPPVTASSTPPPMTTPSIPPPMTTLSTPPPMTTSESLETTPPFTFTVAPPITTEVMNVTVGNEDLQAIVTLPSLEVLIVDQQMGFDDMVMRKISAMCKLRKLSCAACYSVSDQGVRDVALAPITELNLSYCHLVSDDGMLGLAEVGRLHKLIARACPNLTDRGVMNLSRHCTQLQHLDISGCWQLTSKVLYTLQESLLHMRAQETQAPPFSLTVGGTAICGESALQFARMTGSSVSLDDLSTESLWVDYGSVLESVHDEQEDWEAVDDTVRAPLHTPLVEKAYEWLEADDPSLFNDDFSDPEDSGFIL